MNMGSAVTAFKDLSADKLRTWIREKSEGSFSLIDVRQPSEYEAGHIPGAILLPLPELPDRLADIDRSRPAVVYCRSGNRSRSAASLLAGNGIEVFNMTGGMLAWEGQAATGPVDSGMELVKDRTKPEQMVALAWGLEEGSAQFYRAIADRAADENARQLFRGLAEAEEGHKQLVADAWTSATGQDSPALMQEPANTMEGGYAVRDMLAFLESRAPQETLEVAMQVETNAIDLYLKIIQRTGSPAVKGVFSQLVSEEKKHLESLGRMLEAQ